METRNPSLEHPTDAFPKIAIRGRPFFASVLCPMSSLTSVSPSYFLLQGKGGFQEGRGYESQCGVGKVAREGGAQSALTNSVMGSLISYLPIIHLSACLKPFLQSGLGSEPICQLCDLV